MALENKLDTKEVAKLYKKYGNDYVAVLIKYLKDSRKKASGRLINSIKSELKTIANEVDILIKGEDYLNFVDKGRRKGKYPPIRDIKAWCRIKGIPQAAAFPIAKSIFRYGVKPTNVIQKTNTFFLNKETKIIEKDFAKLIEKQVVKNINSIQK